ncbi:MAG: 4Fe-4S binding protein, partial [Muribaculaceae bacterium]|nr:4Fe-4S binding protein [Muribaculaceae bacterium]
NKIYITVQLIANVVVLGFWCGQFLDYALMLKYISTGIALPVGLTSIAMLVAAFIYPIFGHPQHYCNHICPLGSAQILMGEILNYKIKIGAKTINALNWFRKILWAVLMLMLWGDVYARWMDLELFQAFMFESAPVGIIIAALVFIALSTVVARPYCRFVCPTGSLFKRAENLN